MKTGLILEIADRNKFPICQKLSLICVHFTFIFQQSILRARCLIHRYDLAVCCNKRIARSCLVRHRSPTSDTNTAFCFQGIHELTNHHLLKIAFHLSSVAVLDISNWRKVKNFVSQISMQNRCFAQWTLLFCARQPTSFRLEMMALTSITTAINTHFPQNGCCTFIGCFIVLSE